ncbi:MAG TPA: hypothetical protein VHV75_07840 [Solirubrobacteraceae bacterium]|nr:hypothetical protein [Solirubrobacteraceae bacterium]
MVVSVYPDSEKISAAPGVMFRRDDALHSWVERPKPAQVDDAEVRSASARACPELNVLSMAVVRSGGDACNGAHLYGVDLSPVLGAATRYATVQELASGEADGSYHYEWCRKNWAIVLSGHPTLRHAGGTDVLEAGDTAYFPQGQPALTNSSTTPTGQLGWSSSQAREHAR